MRSPPVAPRTRAFLLVAILLLSGCAVPGRESPHPGVHILARPTQSDIRWSILVTNDANESFPNVTVVLDVTPYSGTPGHAQGRVDVPANREAQMQLFVAAGPGDATYAVEARSESGMLLARGDGVYHQPCFIGKAQDC